MNIVIFGATGRTGNYLVSQALERGHTVTAVARQPEAITLRHERLRAVSGFFDQPGTMDAAMSGQAAVLSAVGAPLSRGPSSLYADSARSILAAMGRGGVRRLICVTSGGTNPQHDPNLPFVFEQVFKRLFAKIYRDMMEMEKIVMASDTDWTIVRPAALTDDPATGRLRGVRRTCCPRARRHPVRTWPILCSSSSTTRPMSARLSPLQFEGLSIVIL